MQWLRRLFNGHAPDSRSDRDVAPPVAAGAGPPGGSPIGDEPDDEPISGAQHYFFAHVVLRQNFFARTADMLTVLAGPHAQELLLKFWNYVGEKLPPAQHVEPTGLRAEVREVPGAVAALVHMPPPLQMAHAYLVVMLALTSERAPDADQTPQRRYFTLEHGDGRLVHAEWTESGEHQNYGAARSQEPDEFLKDCLAMAKA